MESNLGLRLLDIDGVTLKTGLKRTAIYLRRKAGTFPAPVALGSRTARWRSDEIDRWIETVSANRAA